MATATSRRNCSLKPQAASTPEWTPKGARTQKEMFARRYQFARIVPLSS